MNRDNRVANNHVADLQESARMPTDPGPVAASVESRPYHPHPAPALMSQVERQEPLTVYLAAAYSRREELCGYRAELQGRGVTVQATWLEGPDQRLINGQMLDAATEAEIETRRFDTERSREYAAMCAQQDLADIEAADAVVMFTGGGRGGGRHLEVGYALALGVPVLLVGARENVFHCLPEVRHAPTWGVALAVILSANGIVEASA